MAKSLEYLLLAVLPFTLSTLEAQESGGLDIALLNGRVMDPESGLNEVRNIGIQDGRIAVVSKDPLRGQYTVDIEGLVVAPGFIDLHAHGQDANSHRFQARDGVTTALDMEVGAFPVASWYASHKGKALINFGATVGHVPARIALMYGKEVGHLTTNRDAMRDTALFRSAAVHRKGTSEEIEQLATSLRQGLNEGALGIGLAIQYVPGAKREEILRLFRVAAESNVACYVHTRSMGEVEPGSTIEAIQEVMANAAVTGASLHIVHITSSCLGQTPLCLEMIEGARSRGLDITAEVYPYTAASTVLQSAVFGPGWREKLSISYKDVEWIATGERLTEESFHLYRKQGGIVIAHMIPGEVAEFAVAHPLVIIASDGLPFFTGKEHPRGAGTFSRVLGHYVREEKALSLMDALRKMTLMPAQRLEKAVPQMRRKGRVKVGADADLTIFSPDRVIDRATYEIPTQFSEGIVHVLVDGEFVVKDSELVTDVFPGQAIRR